ncbi:uncharacterized protein THITE_112236 [Thermothielavioides terrestris NRRL 8126]|uniref:Uncharacterized protein n=1 Tax=Thermothielavioides terrestris (strain ATCC 38088 / NRRL 8126) TaxID=578455 RepID=G2QQJ6_THETT|nr:uncharacterized protein THITE_112236 [Thermothielavioides terrestris NRRL 8126]AEO62406.1 hypothetical protein THITE_112236 [Thermothielavioides terrestris NRRL 8126]
MRSFSTSARKLLQYLGYPFADLPGPWKTATETYLHNGAAKKVGVIKSVEILHRNDGSSPVHKSHYNPNDPEEVISVRIEDENGNKRTHHIYSDGTGTGFVGDKRE